MQLKIIIDFFLYIYIKFKNAIINVWSFTEEW